MTPPNDISARIARAKQRDELSPVAADSMRRLRDHLVSILGWVAATIVALNAGGLATTIGMIDHLNHPFLISSGFFTGLMFMLSSAVCAIISSFDNIRYLTKTASARLHGNEDPVGNRPLKYALITVVLAVLALLSFVTSAILVVADYREDKANDRRCLAIQRDMLSAQPRRADGPDLFQALGCRPQGEGNVYAPRHDVKPLQQLPKPFNRTTP